MPEYITTQARRASPPSGSPRKKIKMRKQLLAAALIAATALGASAEFRWGPTAGINISNYYWKQDLLPSHQFVGPTAGLMGEVMIPGIGFGIDFALRYQMVGATVDFSKQPVWALDGYGNTKIWNHQFQIPVNLRFKWTRMEGLEQYIAPFAYGGPVFSFTVASTDCAALEHPAGWVALQCGIGAEIFERYQISAGYSWGVSYLQRTVKLDNFSSRTQGWQVNLAVLF